MLKTISIPTARQTKTLNYLQAIQYICIYDEQKENIPAVHPMLLNSEIRVFHYL